MSYTYINNVTAIAEKVFTEEQSNINKVVDLLTRKIAAKNQIFAFGASHASILTQELFYRAGGLAIINPILPSSVMLNVRPVTMTSQMERLEGYGKIIAKNTPFKEGDVVIVHSVSGRNPVAIDFVLEAKSKGVTVVAITNVAYSRSVTSRHTSTLRLFEAADYVIDNHGDIGDACVEIENLSQKVSPTSSVIGCMIVNTIVSEVVSNLVKRNIIPPVFFSANIDGGDEHNKEMLEEYKDIIHYQ